MLTIFLFYSIRAREIEKLGKKVNIAMNIAIW